MSDLPAIISRGPPVRPLSGTPLPQDSTIIHRVQRTYASDQARTGTRLLDAPWLRGPARTQPAPPTRLSTTGQSRGAAWLLTRLTLTGPQTQLEAGLHVLDLDSCRFSVAWRVWGRLGRVLQASTRSGWAPPFHVGVGGGRKVPNRQNPSRGPARGQGSAWRAATGLCRAAPPPRRVHELTAARTPHHHTLVIPPVAWPTI